MRNIVYILICLSMASMVSALSITNGDFEALGIRNDVPDWFESRDVYLRLHLNPNPSGGQYMGFPYEDRWAYQSIGVNTGGVPALQIQYEIGGLNLEISPNATNPPSAPAELILTVSLYESDGSFVGADGRNIHGAQGITLIDSVTVTYPRPANDTFITDSVMLQYLGSTSGELFLRFENESGDEDGIDYRFSIDNVQIVPLAPSVVSPLPKDGADFVAIELTSSENDLVFDVADGDIAEVDVMFAPEDPNLLNNPAYKIVDGLSVSQGHYVIDLEGVLTEDLEFSTEYFWKVRAYEPNGLELTLKYESPVWSFTTVQEGPLLGDVDPGKLYVYPGEDAVFSVEDYSKADTFQWRYYPAEGEPNVALTNGADYAGVDTDTLTILDAQLEDEGFYYCIGTETATGLTDQSATSGELRIKLLKSYYPFETVTGGYTPDVISGYDMQLMGASLSDDNPIVGKHLWLDNPKNQWARIADTRVADYEDITISFWCNATTLVNTTDGDRWARIFEFGKDSTEYVFFTMLYRQNDPRQGGNDVARCEFRYFNDEGESQNPELDAEHPDIAPGQWYFVAITIKANDDGDGGRGRIYIGGEHGTEGTSPQVLNVANMKEITKTFNYIGKANGFSAPLFNGRIDEFKIYNYVRSSAEIAEDYLGIVPDDPICDMENYDLWDYDYNDNCKIDLPDFAEIAAHWLEDYRIFPN